MALSDATRAFVRQRAAQRCEYCHADERWQFVRFTIDHVLPRSRGGTDDVENLALACRNCNERRSNRTEYRDPQTTEEVPVFNPRIQGWSDHFVWDSGGTQIIGVTPIGRATVELLDLNDARHGGAVLRVRQRDVADGYQPPPQDSILPK